MFFFSSHRGNSFFNSSNHGVLIARLNLFHDKIKYHEKYATLNTQYTSNTIMKYIIHSGLMKESATLKIRVNQIDRPGAISYNR